MPRIHSNWKISKNNKSGYRGVYWQKEKGKWRAFIRVGTKETHIGYYEDPRDAAYEYDKKAVELFGKLARTNFK